MTKKNHNESLSSKNVTANVYYVPASAQYTTDRDVLVLETILAHRTYGFLSRFNQRDIVGIKLCENSPEPTLQYAHAFARLLRMRGQSPFFCGTSKRHIETECNAVVRMQNELDQSNGAARTHFMALDGMYGEHEISRIYDRRIERDVYLAGELPNLKGLVSISCFVPDADREPCGSIVNLGQGLASKKGKIHQRTTSCPQVHIKKCYACRRCVRACPTRAISILDGHVAINPNKCVKCGKCVEIAHYGGITYDWNATSEHYCNAVAKHAKAALAVLDNEVTCINVIKPDTDTGSFAGAMVSHDPVAADCATLDYCVNARLVSEEYVRRIKERVHSGQSQGVGSVEYDLETVAY